METDGNNVQQNTFDADSGKKYSFDFELSSWNNQQTYKWCNMAEEAQKKIEIERQNVEKDLVILNAIEEEKLRETNLMTSLLQMKEELEKKLNQTENI